MPPIHPIGVQHRKGPNNTLIAGPNDPGSPWAIGAAEGGHDAIHPDLGTFEDFDAFVARATELGLDVALDLALQAAPDHPWVASNPEWFTTRVDGSIAYAENPPKKYQDIYPLNFDNDPEGLSNEILRIVLLWVSHGVKIFRVDNPHTKPVWFWEWLIAEVNKNGTRRGVPRRGLHPPRHDARAGPGRLPAVLHLLHLAQHQGGDRGVLPRGQPRIRGFLPAELLRQHPGHPHRIPAVRRPGGVQDPRGPGRHGQPAVGRLRRLRTLRARGPARRRGVHRQREVRVQGPRLGRGCRVRPHPGAVPHPAQPRSGATTRRCGTCRT